MSSWQIQARAKAGDPGRGFDGVPVFQVFKSKLLFERGEALIRMQFGSISSVDCFLRTITRRSLLNCKTFQSISCQPFSGAVQSCGLLSIVFLRRP